MSFLSADGADSDLKDSLTAALGAHAPQAGSIDAFLQGLMTRHRSSIRLRYPVEGSATQGSDSSAIDQPLPWELDPIAWYSLGFRSADPAIRPSRTIEYAGGAFYLQDAGSFLALAAADADRPPQSDRLVCDLCAAPGGKATALLESIGDGFLLANEPVKSRLAPLAFNLARTGSNRYAISSLDPERLADQLPGTFDLVLVDAPCSGQALLGRGKQTLSSISASQIEHSAQRAKRILAAAVRLLRPGGQLVFSTCTFAELENESQVRWLIETVPDLVPEQTPRLASYASDPSQASYRLWPHLHNCAGSFAASLRWHGPENHNNVRPFTARSKRRKTKQENPASLEEWFSVVPSRIRSAGAVLWGWPEDAPGWVEDIACDGPELAYRTGQTWKPSHAAALRCAPGVLARRCVELDAEAAIKFLAGSPVACSERGWCVVRYQGRPLGWVKASGGTGKNHLPAAARVTGIGRPEV